MRYPIEEHKTILRLISESSEISKATTTFSNAKAVEIEQLASVGRVSSNKNRILSEVTNFIIIQTKRRKELNDEFERVTQQMMQVLEQEEQESLSHDKDELRTWIENLEVLWLAIVDASAQYSSLSKTYASPTGLDVKLDEAYRAASKELDRTVTNCERLRIHTDLRLRTAKRFLETK